MAKSYGPDHRAAREEKLASLEVKACEVTDSDKRLNAHHSCPRLFNGPDIASNYIMLSEHFHAQVLHALCNVTDKELVQDRIALTNQIKNNLHNDVKVKAARNEIEEIDAKLVREYIHNILNKLPHDVRERVLELTLYHSFTTIRDQAIKILQLESKPEAI